MILFKTIASLRARLQQAKQETSSVGFVPTMGALHEGHASLIRESRAKSDVTVCSIFVNPRQFNDASDFEKYPRTIENDILLLEKNHTNILFLPSADEMYPVDDSPVPQYDLGYLENILEGFYRPGHFQGVCRAVHRLLSIVEPDMLFLGQKDYQQCMVVRKMMKDFGLSAQLHISPTLREASGLAMSSRNMRLSTRAKENAAAISKALVYIKEHIQHAPVTELKNTASQIIMHAGFDKVDYIEICDATTLKPVEQAMGGQKLVTLAAAFIEGVRLIDNMLIN